jgi:hypothetical protein
VMVRIEGKAFRRCVLALPAGFTGGAALPRGAAVRDGIGPPQGLPMLFPVALE